MSEYRWNRYAMRLMCYSTLFFCEALGLLRYHIREHVIVPYMKLLYMRGSTIFLVRPRARYMSRLGGLGTTVGSRERYLMKAIHMFFACSPSLLAIGRTAFINQPSRLFFQRRVGNVSCVRYRFFIQLAKLFLRIRLHLRSYTPHCYLPPTSSSHGLASFINGTWWTSD